MRRWMGWIVVGVIIGLASPVLAQGEGIEGAVAQRTEAPSADRRDGPAGAPSQRGGDPRALEGGTSRGAPVDAADARRDARRMESRRQDEEAVVAWAYLMRDDRVAESVIDQMFGESGQWLSEASLAGNAAWRWMLALLSVVLVLALRKWLLGFLYRTLYDASLRTKTDLDRQFLEAVRPTVFRIALLLGVAAGFLWLEVAPHLRAALWVTFRIVMVLLVAQGFYRGTHVLGNLLQELNDGRDLKLSREVISLAPRILRVVVWILAAIFVVQEMGYQVGGLLAGLGVGGLAFALAARDTLSNWFGALMIFTDRPFAVGDWVKTGSLEGTVEEIGLRSTKVRTFARTVVSIPNSVLANDVIENFSRMPMRRVFFSLGVTYATTPSMMQESLERIRDILRGHPGVDQGFHMVRFTDFGESSLDIMVYYFTTSTVWDEYLAVREDVNLKMMASLEEIGVSVAFPTRSVYVEQRMEEERERLDGKARELHAARAPKVREIASERGNEDAL